MIFIIGAVTVAVAVGIVWARARGLLGDDSRAWAAMVAVAGLAAAFVTWIIGRGGVDDEPVRAQFEDAAATREAIDVAEAELVADIADIEADSVAAVAVVRDQMTPSVDAADAAARFDKEFPL